MVYLWIACGECGYIGDRTLRNRIRPCPDCGGQIEWISLEIL
jgi:endogenous inhibitor of DNA gyrase (YacG/DUF329 family)